MDRNPPADPPADKGVDQTAAPTASLPSWASWASFPVSDFALEPLVDSVQLPTASEHHLADTAHSLPNWDLNEFQFPALPDFPALPNLPEWDFLAAVPGMPIPSLEGYSEQQGRDITTAHPSESERGTFRHVWGNSDYQRAFRQSLKSSAEHLFDENAAELKDFISEIDAVEELLVNRIFFADGYNPRRGNPPGAVFRVFHAILKQQDESKAQPPLFIDVNLANRDLKNLKPSSSWRNGTITVFNAICARASGVKLDRWLKHIAIQCPLPVFAQLPPHFSMKLEQITFAGHSSLAKPAPPASTGGLFSEPHTPFSRSDVAGSYSASAAASAMADAAAPAAASALPDCAIVAGAGASAPSVAETSASAAAAYRSWTSSAEATSQRGSRSPGSAHNVSRRSRKARLKSGVICHGCQRTFSCSERLYHHRNIHCLSTELGPNEKACSRCFAILPKSNTRHLSAKKASLPSVPCPFSACTTQLHPCNLDRAIYHVKAQHREEAMARFSSGKTALEAAIRKDLKILLGLQ